MKNLKLIFVATALCAIAGASLAQHHHGGGERNPKLHVNPRWRECSFQLDQHLTQAEWREFTREAGLVAYFRPLAGARPMGAMNFEVAILQWSSAIDEHKDAWNDTFVHPDSTHWLIGGPRLPIPGFTARMGITDRLDAGVYWTKSFGANYGFWGAQAQYSVLRNDERKLNTSVRGTVVRMYGPEDLNLTVYGAEVLASRDWVLDKRWMTLTPYAVLSAYLSASHEKSHVVELNDEHAIGLQGTAGVVAKIAVAHIGVEYNLAAINTVSMKLGVSF